ncbi:MAG TPA: hypothetical protein VK395_32305 [Gemmataceae bacterium]|nr:hypothetical protein [Gemmataceae bacterium]
MFHELLDNPKGNEPGPLQSNAHRLFPSVVKKSHFERRLPSDPVPSDGKYIILGIATYSPEELQLLDDVEAAHQHWDKASKVVVFDVMECRDMNDMRGYVPPLGVVVQTPVVAFWDGGKLVESQTGLRMTRELLQNRGLLR